MWFEPRLRSTYRPRRTFDRLWSQYYQYGWWRAVTVRKHRTVASPRHLVPATLVAGLAAGRSSPRSPADTVGRSLGAWAGGALSWAVVLGLAGWRERGAPAGVAIRVPMAVGCLHLAYGTGFWAGVLAQALGRAGGSARPGPIAPGHPDTTDAPTALE